MTLDISQNMFDNIYLNFSFHKTYLLDISLLKHCQYVQCVCEASYPSAECDKLSSYTSSVLPHGHSGLLGSASLISEMERFHFGRNVSAIISML